MTGLSKEDGYPMLTKGKFSDFTVTCRNLEFRVNRVILEQAGDFFRVAVSDNFKEGTSGTMDFPEDHPTIVARAIITIYGGDFSDDAQADHSEIWHPRAATPSKPFSDEEDPSTLMSTLEIGLQTYHFAEKYGMDQLKAAALNKFMVQASRDFGSTEFESVLEKVFEMTSGHAEGLRLAVVRLCITKRKAVRENARILSIIQTHEPIAFRCGSAEIREEFGDYWELSSELHRWKSCAIKLAQCLADRVVCNDCGLQVGAKVEFSQYGRHSLHCPDCKSLMHAFG